MSWFIWSLDVTNIFISSHMYHFFMEKHLHFSCKIILSVWVFVSVYVCVPPMCLVALEDRGEWQIPVKPSVQATMLGTEPKSSLKTESTSNNWPMSSLSQNDLYGKAPHSLKWTAYYGLYSFYCATVHQHFLFVSNLVVSILALMWGWL